MSPRRSQAEARHTREAIVDRAVSLASVLGLDGLTIGALAADLQMSKSGVLGHFGTKEALQLSTLAAACDVFTREVWGPSAGVEDGMPRLEAICDAWMSYLEARRLSGRVLSHLCSVRVRWTRRAGCDAVAAAGGTGATPACSSGTAVLAPTYVSAGVGGKPTVMFSTVNVQVLSGAGSTSAAVNGEGNLIVGYAENRLHYAQTGSNDLVLGADNGWSSYGRSSAGTPTRRRVRTRRRSARRTRPGARTAWRRV